jgi:5-methyltetrahydropteroyltriglutamate--homocysteine methyltransferase
MKSPKIKTTVVGSYPLPDWAGRGALGAGAARTRCASCCTRRSRPASTWYATANSTRFDLKPSRTNGMIEVLHAADERHPQRDRFSRSGSPTPKGRGHALSRQAAWRRGRPWSAPGTLNLSLACARASAGRKAAQIHADRPAHAGKTLHDLHYRSPEKLAHAIADVLARR